MAAVFMWELACSRGLASVLRTVLFRGPTWANGPVPHHRCQELEP